MILDKRQGVPCLRCAMCGSTTGDVPGGQNCANCGTSMERVLLKVTKRLFAVEQEVMTQTRQDDGIVACRLKCGHAVYLHDIPEDEEVVSTGCAKCARENPSEQPIQDNRPA